jgi:two-component system, NarL family, sensor kinase
MLFYSDRNDMLGNVVVDRTIRRILSNEFELDLDIRSEYFETLPVKTEDYPFLLEWLRRKYSGTTFDVIVPIGANALNFLREYHQELFNGAQIVFWGASAAIDNWGSGPTITGVVAPPMNKRIQAAFTFIRTLQPDLENLVVVSGTSSADRDWEEAARRELRQVEDRVEVTYLAGLSFENVQTRIMNLPPQTAILFLTMNRDGAGRDLLKFDALKKIVDTATAPVYSTSALHLDTGIIGGALIDQESMAADAAGQILRLLRGESIRGIPIQESSLVPMINWKGADRWGINENRLPRGTVTLYKEESPFVRYRWQILGIICFCILEGVLIAALLIQRTHRRRAEKSLQESKRLLQSSIDALDARIALLDEKGTIIAVNQRWRSFVQMKSYVDVEKAVGFNYLDVFESIPESERRRIADGMRALMLGQVEDFRCIYRCVNHDRRSWYQVHVHRFQTDGVLRFVVSHEDVTEIKEAHETQQRLTALLLRAQDDERRRIARDLHDVTVQNVAAIKADLSRYQRESEGCDLNAVKPLETLSVCDQVVKELRTLSYLLHPPLLDEAGLITAIKWFVRGFIQRSGIRVELQIMEDIGRLPVAIETALFRVVQESLTNIHRHSGSSTATICVIKNQDTVLIRIGDQGHGFAWPPTFDDTETMRPAGVGLLGMSQRLKQVGGELEIESSSNGSNITARVSIS